MVVSLVACGGGGGTDSSTGSASGGTPTTSPVTGPANGGTTNPPSQPGTPESPPSTPPATGAASMAMSCPEGASHQCSGDSVYRWENGIALTRSGVHAFAASTSDLVQPNLNKTGAFGMQRSTRGTAEVRLAKNNEGASSATILLRDLDLKWDGRTERPPIFETFRMESGRIGINGNGTLSTTELPAPSNLAFYDYASKTFSATQAHYANNVYFPRTGNPSRCGPDVNPCPERETSGFYRRAGNWRVGGQEPDVLSAIRVHEDGDIHAGNGFPASDGSTTYLPGGNGIGVPFPGSKGYRDFVNWGYRHANLATWLTQDTVLIEEWAAMGDEHNKNRRGVVAFGDVTPSTLVTASGSATYRGIVYGWHAPNPAQDPVVFRGNAVISVDFASRRLTLAFTDTRAYDDNGATVPADLTTAAAAGATGTDSANYFTGAVDASGLRGGISGRFFGPAPAGAASVIPDEIGGVLSVAGSSSVIIGGFIGRRQ